MAGAPAWHLFVSPACPVCAEAEAVVGAAGLQTQKRRVLPGPRPGSIIIEPDGREAPASVVPATPALWDVRSNVLHVGLAAIERAVGAC